MALQINHLHARNSTVTGEPGCQATRFVAVEFSLRVNAGDADG